MEIFNATPFPHPMRLHGHTFQGKASPQRRLAPYLADTVVVAPKAQITVAFVADNPRAWMLHCHVIEQQATGMMGVISVFWLKNAQTRQALSELVKKQSKTD